jgi:hypothetical protein
VFPAGSAGGFVSRTRNELLPLEPVAPAVKILFDVEIAVPTAGPSKVSDKITAAEAERAASRANIAAADAIKQNKLLRLIRHSLQLRKET